MSDPEQLEARTTSGFRERSASRRSSEARHKRRALSASVLLHFFVIVGVIFLTPWRRAMEELQIQKEPLDRAFSHDELTSLDDTLERINVSRMQQKISLLREFEEKIGNLGEAAQEKYDTYLSDQQSAAPEKTRDAAKRVIRAMARASEALARGDNEQVRQEQHRTEVLQQQVLGKLSMLPAEPVMEVVALQEEDVRLQGVASEAFKKVGSIKGEQNVRQEVRKFTHQMEQSGNRVRQLQGGIARTKQEIGREQKAIEKHHDAIAKHEHQLKEITSGKHRQQIQTYIERHRGWIEGIEERIEEKNTRIDGLREEILEAERLSTAAAQERSDVLEELEKAKLVATQAQERARKVQEKTVDQIEKVVSDSVSQTGSVPSELPLREERKEVDDERKIVQQTGKNVAELFEEAELIEQKLTDAFERIRAMELAVLREVSLKHAQGVVDDVTPVRHGIDRIALAATPRTGSAFKAKRQAVVEVLKETESMVDLARLLEGQLFREANSAGGSRLALALAGGPVLSNASSETDDEGLEATLVEEEELTRKAGVKPGRQVAVEFGRRIEDRGDSAEWIVIGSWYVIGPWDNSERRNLDRQFPPESIIDLDAMYLGKHGETIKWQFVTTTHPKGCVQPLNAEPYGVWYATTEIYLEREQTLWVALGSDDRGTLWVNGRRVWLSAPQHKIWRPMEAVIPVSFRAGRNRLLLRCENGKSVMGFSMSAQLREEM